MKPILRTCLNARAHAEPGSRRRDSKGGPALIAWASNPHRKLPISRPSQLPARRLCCGATRTVNRQCDKRQNGYRLPSPTAPL
jgi:hypothetical protein